MLRIDGGNGRGIAWLGRAGWGTAGGEAGADNVRRLDTAGGESSRVSAMGQQRCTHRKRGEGGGGGSQAEAQLLLQPLWVRFVLEFGRRRLGRGVERLLQVRAVGRAQLLPECCEFWGGGVNNAEVGRKGKTKIQPWIKLDLKIQHNRLAKFRNGQENGGFLLSFF